MLVRGWLGTPRRRQGGCHDPRVPLRHRRVRGSGATGTEEQGQLYLLKLREHYERIVDSAKVLLMDHGYSVDRLVELTRELVRRNDYRQDVYVRATIYKSSQAIGVRLHNVECRVNVLAIPFGDYIATEGGISCGTVSWRRTSDLAIPSRAKVVGSYANPALSKSEAVLNGFDEAIVLTRGRQGVRGRTEEPVHGPQGRAGDARRRQRHPRGITRAGIMEMAERELGRTVSGPSTGPSCTWRTRSSCAAPGAQISPVTSIDHRPIGTGGVGPVASRITSTYFDMSRAAGARVRALGDPGLLIAGLAPRPPGSRSAAGLAARPPGSPLGRRARARPPGSSSYAVQSGRGFGAPFPTTTTMFAACEESTAISRPPRP
ncbi:MAG: aminotransferase class IV [Chloroflexota bacterium]